MIDNKTRPTIYNLTEFRQAPIGDLSFFVARPRKCGERELEMKTIKSIIILLVAIPAMAVYALFEAINALAIEIDLVRIRTMMRCCRKFKTL